MDIQEILSYTNLGWHVIPIQPRGKIPIIKDWVNQATTSEGQILEWWGTFPNANVGIATGRISGVCVIDIDVHSGGYETMQNLKFPLTPTAKSGSGGFHYFYKIPLGLTIRSDSNILKGIDSRGEGGQIIVSPSIHDSGNQYEWLKDPWSTPLATVPDWWIDALAVKGSKNRNREPVKDGDKIFKGDRDEYLFSQAVTLVNTGLPFNACYAALLQVNKEQIVPSFNDDYVYTKIQSAYKKHDLVIDRKLEQESNERAVKRMIEFEDNQKATLKLSELPDTSKPPAIVLADGILKDITDYIVDSAMLPQRELAFGAALAFGSLLVNQKYRTQTDIRANLYTVCIADSGSGKDHARKCIKNLAKLAGMSSHLGGEKINSGNAINASLEANPIKLYPIDEFGHMLQSTTAGRADFHQKQILTELVKLYSSANSLYTGIDSADRKLKPSVPIDCPFVSLYGTTTPNQFYDAFKSGMAADGALARFLIIEGQKEWVSNVVPKITEPSQELVQQIIALYNYKTASGDLADLGVKIAPITVYMQDQVYTHWFDLREKLKPRIQSGEIEASVYSRVGENAMKIALIQAVLRNYQNPRIDIDDYNLGLSWALWSADMVIESYKKYGADTQIGSWTNKVEHMIKDCKKDGILVRQLKNRKLFRDMKSSERVEILEYLEESGTIYKLLIDGVHWYIHKDYHKL